MSYRFLASMAALPVMMTLALAPASVAAQDSAATGTTSANTWTGRTPDGQPDLQGIWANDTSTPLERPRALAGKKTLTDQELAERERRALQNRNARDRRDQAPGAVTDVGRAYNALWFPVPGKPIDRTSLILDPPDGRVPPLKPEALQRYAAYAKARGLFGSSATPGGRGGDEGAEDGTEGGVDGRGSRADNPEDRNLGERCLVSTLPRLPGGYNNHLQIVQTSDHVIIEIEMHHHARVIPLDGRPHLPPSVRQWLGDSRGHWEGNTLVVETTNFNDKAPFRGSFEGRRMVERFTRIDADTLNYEVTIDDPTTFTRPWTISYPSTSLRSRLGGEDGIQVAQMFEYACHEGNYGLQGQLSSARAEDRAVATKKGSR